MIEGAKLRCLIARPPFVVGRVYEGAEILEYPEHVMVRKPDGKWPVPGDPYFCWHPEECFESPKQGIPAISCGYRWAEEDFFGVILRNAIYATPKTLPYPRMSPEHRRLSNIVDSVKFPGLWYSTHKVLPRVCWPEDLGQRFTLIGVNHWVIWSRSSVDQATKAIKNVMAKLRIPPASMPPIEHQNVEYWTRSRRKAGGLTWKTVKH